MLRCRVERILPFPAHLYLVCSVRCDNIGTTGYLHRFTALQDLGYPWLLCCLLPTRPSDVCTGKASEGSSPVHRSFFCFSGWNLPLRKRTGPDRIFRSPVFFLRQTLMNEYSANLSVIVCAFFEFIVIAYIYGSVLERNRGMF